MAVVDRAQPLSAASEPRGRGLILLQLLAGAGAASLALMTLSWQRWDLAQLLLIAGLAVISDLLHVETGSAKLRVSGCHLALMLAAVLLGPGPAGLVGLVTIAVGWLRSREQGHYLRNNLLVFTWFPLLAAVIFHVITTLSSSGPYGVSYYLVVLAASMVAVALNFLGIAAYQCRVDGSSLASKAREALLPLLSADLFSGLLTCVAVYIAVRKGVVGLLLDSVVLLIFQYLVSELLKSKQRGERLHQMATTDDLTGLANREAFRTCLQARISEAMTTGLSFGVMLMDLDHFKEINDTLGHGYGDDLLRELGPRLAGAVRGEGLVARLGGDEFAVLGPPGRADDETLERLAGELLEAAQQPFWLDELSIEVSGSIGIARFPTDGTDPDTLLRHADGAMYQAKEHQSGSAMYCTGGEAESTRRLTVLSEFRRALRSEEILLHYQPILDLGTQLPQGVEALVRWQHPERGLLSPGSFVREVERTGLIAPMTRHILQCALAQSAEWREQGLDLAVAVNLSARNLLDRDLLRDIEALLARHGVSPERLKLEITESMLMSDPARAKQTVIGLSQIGVQISVDDFGTGYSSLANLRSLPINELKIDRSFVTPMLQNESDLIIVRSTINLAHDLGLSVTAEGVEDGATLSSLALLGCDLVQGFHLSRPLPGVKIAPWMQGGSPQGPPVAKRSAGGEMVHPGEPGEITSGQSLHVP